MDFSSVDGLANFAEPRSAIRRLELPGKLGKKEATLKQNTTKVETLLYDLSVVKSSGGGSGGGGDSGGAEGD